MAKKRHIKNVKHAIRKMRNRIRRNGARNGSHSVYTLCDYPKLFGWEPVGHSKTSPPLVLTHKGRKYLRLSFR